MSNKCKCGKGHASQNKDNPWYGQCKPCWLSSLTRRELKKLGEKRP